MTRAAAYVRISRDREGEALGVGRQEADARALAARHGWEVVRVYSDNDVSAAAYRPAYEALLKDLAERRIDAIVAYSSSRLYRDVDVDKARLFSVCIARERADGHRVSVETVVSGTIDPYTADGRMMANILASVDQAERERASERRRRQLADKKARGEWHGGWRRFGYRPTPDGLHLVVDQAEAAVIRDGARALLAGDSAGAVVRRWATEGVRTPRGATWHAGNLNVLMTRDMPGVLDESDTRRLRALFDARRTGPRREGKRLLTGIATCVRCEPRRPLVSRPNAGVRCYVCVNADDATRAPRVHLRIAAEPLERFVIEEAGRRWIAPPALAVESPLFADAERVRAEMDELATADLPLRVLERRALHLQRTLDSIEAELLRVDPDLAADSAQRAAAYQVGAQLEGWPDASTDPELRSWLASLVEYVEVAPARGGNRFDTSRAKIVWRDGVVLRS